MTFSPEHTRQERFTSYAAYLKERFNSGMLAQLQGVPQWVVWRAEVDGEGKQKKAPYNPNVRQAYASVKAPKSWGTVDQALTALATGLYSGLGFIITPPLVMVDLDNSFDKASGTITNPQAEIIMQGVHSYFEASPYKGLHGLVYVGRPIRNLHTDEIEIYGYDRFTTITTDHIEGTPTTIELRTEAIEALYRQFAPVLPTPPIQNTRGGEVRRPQLHELPPEAESDPVLQRLLRGDMTGFESQSSADFVFIMKLLHWTGDNVSLTRDLFLSSPLGQREKATRKTGEVTYVDMTINNAIRKRRNPPQNR